MSITVQHQEPAGLGLTVTEHADAVAVRTSPLGELQLANDDGDVIVAYQPGRAHCHTIDRTAPAEQAEEAGADEAPLFPVDEPADATLTFTGFRFKDIEPQPEPDAVNGGKFTTQYARMIIADSPAELAEKKIRAMEAAEQEKIREVADLIGATPDWFGRYSGPELLRAYDRGVADLAAGHGCEV